MSNHSVVRTTSSALKRILLVENDENNRQLLSDLLSYYGYSILALAGSSGFFKAVASFQPHLILLDLKLDGTNGYSLLEEIQHSTEYRNIPVIVISAYAFKAQIQRAYDLGIRRYIVKPINITDLTQAIQEQLYIRGQGDKETRGQGD